MTDTTAPAAHSAFRVLAALAELGEATAAAIADKAGLGYSTTTPKLRAWEDTGQAERFRGDDGRTLWRLTAAGRIATAAPANVRHVGDDHAEADPPVSADATTGSDVAPAEAAAEPNAADNPDGAGECDGTEPDEASADPSSHDPIGQPAVTGQPRSSGRSGAPALAVSADAGEPVEAAPQPEHLGEELAEVPPVATAQDSDAQRDSADGASAATTDEDVTAEATNRRGAGTLRAAILDVLEANPDRRYKVSELCKLIDRANEGTGAKKASAGAVHNAATKLVQAGTAVLAAEKPVTFALARSDA
jgi:hypothetical protein